ncbi:hypothetical protein [Pantoea sp. SoEX]|uniref:hypothetical protein n=1 Tax=Pantoea sp. SoEX TaxID=2576763 RepID=UPI00135A57A5|nr:hypothetical protein [Pantoea sp. SoEX]MXP51320.1 hypothetical protein [Pantoea sp. SoEX]
MKNKKSESISLICNEIHNQRINLSTLKNDWIMGMTKYDNYWLIIMNVSKYLFISSGILALFFRKFRRFNYLLKCIKYGYLGFLNSLKVIRYLVNLIKFI